MIAAAWLADDQTVREMMPGEIIPAFIGGVLLPRCIVRKSFRRGWWHGPMWSNWVEIPANSPIQASEPKPPEVEWRS